MSVWVRFLANPKLLGRFLKTKAGRKAAFKWGGMLVKSRAAQSLIDKFINRNGKRLNKDKSYRDLEKKYENIQKRIAELEKQFEKSHESQSAIQTNTFTLGRQVIEMQQLYTQMQSELQHIQQQQITKNTARTR